ncbi:MAG: glucose-6-phosphate dehydrogenase [Verrucomicrobia bacterium]|nr:glucose-6-phosphate dehydrogenase [Verrucomicrobiota bacterium]
MSSSANPLREGLTMRPQPKPCTVVIFGATGDLTMRKLLPALYNLAADGDLPPSTAIVGFARREKTDDVFRQEMETAVRKFSRQTVRDELWNSFVQGISYHQSEFTDDDGYRRLAERLDQIDAERGTGGRRLFYLSVAPAQFGEIVERLKKYNLHVGKDGGWARVIVEKPFGTNLPTAEALNNEIAGTFPESAVYRIDHFLGKETAQNIMVLRFANAIFEPIWNNRYIDHVQITAGETLGVENRAGYYETSGALRDMIQNHLIQLMTLTAMEPPTSLHADAVRDEKVKVLRALRRMNSPAEVTANVIRGQYAAGAIMGKEVPAYRNDANVNPQSMTETYVGMRIFVDNWRWAGVPFYVRSGKRLPKSGAEIAVQFKRAPSVLFNQGGGDSSNNLVIRIQPDEGISMRMQAKLPGGALRIEPVKMDFQYGASFGRPSPEAYERLILDAMGGDATLFARRDEVEEAWKFVDPILDAWHGPAADQPPLTFYPAGSPGPVEADQLLAADGREWRRI